MTTERHQLPAYPLRMPVELRERLEAAAKVNMRSLNAEILFRLQQSLATTSYLDWPSMPVGRKFDLKDYT